MKFIIVFACLFAYAFANHDAQVLRSETEVNPDSYKYVLEIDNHIKAEQAGALHEHDNWIVHGEYEWISPEGKPVKVTYKADDLGYHPIVHL